MGVSSGALCSACTNEPLEVQVELPGRVDASEMEDVEGESCSCGGEALISLTKDDLSSPDTAAHEVELPAQVAASEMDVLGGDSCSRGREAISPLTKGDISRPEILAHEDISRCAFLSASTVADLPQQSRDAALEANDFSTSSDVDVSDGWADWTVATTLCENSHRQRAEQHQQSCSEEIDLGSLAPDKPEMLPRFASLGAPQPSCMVATRSLSEHTPQTRSVGIQATDHTDLAPTAHTSVQKQQRPQQESQQELQQELQRELQQEPVQELLPPPARKAWPLLPSVGTWLLPQTRSHSAATTRETDAAVEVWHSLPSVGTWLHPSRHCRNGNHSATTISCLLHAKDSAEVAQDVDQLKKVMLSNLRVKPANQALKVDSLLAFDPYAPCANKEHGETFHGSKEEEEAEEECPVS